MDQRTNHLAKRTLVAISWRDMAERSMVISVGILEPKTDATPDPLSDAVATPDPSRRLLLQLPALGDEEPALEARDRPRLLSLPLPTSLPALLVPGVHVGVGGHGGPDGFVRAVLLAGSAASGATVGPDSFAG